MVALELIGRRLYFNGNTFAVKDKIRALGATWDGERKQWWIGSGKRADAEQLVGELNAHAAAVANGTAKKEQAKPDDVRLLGKGTYKGKTYYVAGKTQDGARLRLVTLPNEQDEYLEFWADANAVTMTKTYAPRTRTWRGRTETTYTTLGSIAAFIARQKDPDTRRGQCYECGEWGDAGEDCPHCHEGSFA